MYTAETLRLYWGAFSVEKCEMQGAARRVKVTDWKVPAGVKNAGVRGQCMEDEEAHENE